MPSTRSAASRTVAKASGKMSSSVSPFWRRSLNSTVFACSCGLSYTSNYVDPLGHAEVLISGYAPTCTESGLSDGMMCSRCGVETVGQTWLPATGHAWDNGVITLEPTEETEEVSSRRAAPTTIHIRAAGDLNVTKSVVESGLVASGYDFSRAFLDVSHLLSDADMTVLNFNGTISGEPYGSDTNSSPVHSITPYQKAAYQHHIQGIPNHLVDHQKMCRVQFRYLGLLLRGHKSSHKAYMYTSPYSS